MHRQEASIPPGEEWYYEIAGRTHGPLAQSELEEMLSHSGETALDVRIRKGADGPWTFYRPVANSRRSCTPELSPELQASLRSTQTSIKSQPAGHSPWEREPIANSGKLGLRGRLSRNKELLAVVAVWLTANAVILFLSSDPYTRERRYLDSLRSVLTEVEELRKTPASDAEWTDLRKRSQTTLTPIVRDLQKSANAAELPRQQLLWCARDLAPKVVGPQTKERDQQERRLKMYIQSVENCALNAVTESRRCQRDLVIRVESMSGRRHLRPLPA